MRRWVVAAIVLASAAVAATAPCAPTGTPVDPVLTAGFAALVTLAASRARRWSWLVLAGLAGVGARGVGPAIAATVAVLTAFFAVLDRGRRSRRVGALVGALSIQVLLRLPATEVHGLTAALTAVAVIPVVVSAYGTLRSGERRVVRRVGFVVGGVVALVVLIAGAASLQARREVSAAVSAARLGFQQARDGEQQAAATNLRSAATRFDAAGGIVRSPIVAPARGIPIVAQHLAAADELAASGARLAVAAAEAAETAPYDDLRASAGQVDLALLARMEDPVRAAADALSSSASRLAAVDSPWLLPVLARPLEEFERQIAETAPGADLAATAIGLAPELLGAQRPARYFIAFGTPAESRYLGGFIGSYGELTVRSGKIELTASGTIRQLSDAPGADTRTLSGLGEFEARHGRYFPTRYLQNMSATPDFPTMAEVARQLYPQAGGSEIDGVLYLDPFGLAALLRLTGPVEIPGTDVILDADNAATFLLREQYLRFAGDDRSDVLDRAVRAAFEALTSRDLPGPRAIGEALGPAVRDGRLAFTTFSSSTRPLFERLGTTTPFPSPGTGDLVSFRTANGGASKIDVFVTRRARYDVVVDPASGAIDATLTVSLRNDAPASGLPDTVIGVSPLAPELPPPYPPGTAVVAFSLYSPLELVDATHDGRPLAVQAERELGVQTYSNQVAIPSVSATTLVFRLRGRLATSGAYPLVWSPQPLASPDEVEIRVRTVEGWQPEAAGTSGFSLEGREAVARPGGFSPSSFHLRFRRG